MSRDHTPKLPNNARFWSHGALLYHALPDGNDVMLVPQIHNVAIRRGRQGSDSLERPVVIRQPGDRRARLDSLGSGHSARAKRLDPEPTITPASNLHLLRAGNAPPRSI